MTDLGSPVRTLQSKEIINISQGHRSSPYSTRLSHDENGSKQGRAETEIVEDSLGRNHEERGAQCALLSLDQGARDVRSGGSRSRSPTPAEEPPASTMEHPLLGDGPTDPDRSIQLRSDALRSAAVRELVDNDVQSLDTSEGHPGENSKAQHSLIRKPSQDEGRPEACIEMESLKKRAPNASGSRFTASAQKFTQPGAFTDDQRTDKQALTSTKSALFASMPRLAQEPAKSSCTERKRKRAVDIDGAEGDASYKTRATTHAKLDTSNNLPVSENKPGLLKRPAAAPPPPEKSAAYSIFDFPDSSPNPISRKAPQLAKLKGGRPTKAAPKPDSKKQTNNKRARKAQRPGNLLKSRANKRAKADQTSDLSGDYVVSQNLDRIQTPARGRSRIKRLVKQRPLSIANFERNANHTAIRDDMPDDQKICAAQSLCEGQIETTEQFENNVMRYNEDAVANNDAAAGGVVYTPVVSNRVSPAEESHTGDVCPANDHPSHPNNGPMPSFLDHGESEKNPIELSDDITSQSSVGVELSPRQCTVETQLLKQVPAQLGRNTSSPIPIGSTPPILQSLDPLRQFVGKACKNTLGKLEEPKLRRACPPKKTMTMEMQAAAKSFTPSAIPARSKCNEPVQSGNVARSVYDALAGILNKSSPISRGHASNVLSAVAVEDTIRNEDEIKRPDAEPCLLDSSGERYASTKADCQHVILPNAHVVNATHPPFVQFPSNIPPTKRTARRIVKESDASPYHDPKTSGNPMGTKLVNKSGPLVAPSTSISPLGKSKDFPERHNANQNDPIEESCFHLSPMPLQNFSPVVDYARAHDKITPHVDGSEASTQPLHAMRSKTRNVFGIARRVDLYGSPIPVGFVVPEVSTVLETYSQQAGLPPDHDLERPLDLSGPNSRALPGATLPESQILRDLSSMGRRQGKPASTSISIFQDVIENDKGLDRPSQSPALPDPESPIVRIDDVQSIMEKRRINPGSKTNPHDDPFVVSRKNTCRRIPTTLTCRFRAVDVAESSAPERSPSAYLVEDENDPDKTLCETDHSMSRYPKMAPTMSLGTSDLSDDAQDGSQRIEDLNVWRNALAPHQMDLFDELVAISHKLVRHLVDAETAAKDLVDDFRRRGSRIIAQMEEEQANEFGAYKVMLGQGSAKMVRDLEKCFARSRNFTIANRTDADLQEEGHMKKQEERITELMGAYC